MCNNDKLWLFQGRDISPTTCVHIRIYCTQSKSTLLYVFEYNKYFLFEMDFGVTLHIHEVDY